MIFVIHDVQEAVLLAERIAVMSARLHLQELIHTPSEAAAEDPRDRIPKLRMTLVGDDVE